MQKQHSNIHTQVTLVYTLPTTTSYKVQKLLKLDHKAKQLVACTTTPNYPNCIAASNTCLWTHMHLSATSTRSALLLIILFLVLALIVLHLHTKRKILASREAGIVTLGACRHRFSILTILVGEGGANCDNRFNNISWMAEVYY